MPALFTRTSRPPNRSTGARAAASIDHFWPLTRTHIYGELAKLEALGYVTGVEVEQRHLPDKRVYSLTPEGEQALRSWLDDPDPGTPRPRQPMLVKLFFGEHVSPEQTQTLLMRYREQVLARRDRYAAYAAEDLPPGVDPWEALAGSEDPATGALARWWSENG